MNSEKEVIYFELNNWFSGEHYPAEEPFTTWIGNDLNPRRVHSPMLASQQTFP